MSSLLDCIVRAFWPHEHLRLHLLSQALFDLQLHLTSARGFTVQLRCDRVDFL
uniref:Uncharacterized protein n=1 Tax=Rhizobium loti TaxID=381 RepID=Q8KGS7_RHILI|nr:HYPOTHETICAL PROTEIN [Mesorhizobium japonicum R7A]